MKPLYDCIMESVSVVAQKNGYRLVTLVSRKGIDCKNLTKEQFCEMMYTDLEKAQDEYSRLVFDERKKMLKAHKERLRAYNQMQADKRYKQKAKHQEYLDKLNFASDQDSYSLNYKADISFDFHLRTYGSNSINTDRLTAGTDKKKMELCFDEVSTSKWWERGTGWILTYLCTADSLLPNSWGEIILLMDEKSMAEKKDLDNAIDKAISDYYANNRYTGD